MSDGTGYGIATVPTVGVDEGSGGGFTSLTDRLGCTEMAIDVYRLADRGAVDLAPERERIVVPLGDGRVTFDGRFGFPSVGIGRVPPGRPCTIVADGRATVLVVSVATAAGDGGEPTILDVDAVEFVVPSTSDVETAFLTSALGCTGLKANVRRLDPGQVVPYHTEGTQEEVFVPLDDDATMRIDDEWIDTPRGTVVRVAPETPRSAVNDGEAPARWLMFGAPPTGGPTDWDPGATVVE